jgi:hypothetical protein
MSIPQILTKLQSEKRDIGVKKGVKALTRYGILIA